MDTKSYWNYNIVYDLKKPSKLSFMAKDSGISPKTL